MLISRDTDNGRQCDENRLLVLSYAGHCQNFQMQYFTISLNWMKVLSFKRSVNSCDDIFKLT